MRAVRLHSGDSTLHLDEIEMPVAANDDQVVVKVNACGVCFSDIHVVDGDFGDKPRPLTLGHEVTGWTEEHGNVFVYTPWGCGNCRFCAAGSEMICPDSHEAGMFDQGGYADYMLVPHRRYIFPLGNLDCFYTPCVSGGEYLEFAIAPITYDGKSNLKDLGYSYEIYFRVPESFLMTASNGRGMRILEISKLSATEMALVPGFRNYRLTIEPMAYSSFVLKEVLNGNLVDKASEESDNGAVWFWGSRDSRMATFGDCKNLEALSVTGNVFYLNSPEWNPIAKSIEVSTTAPHYKSDGSLNLGYFQAKVTTDMAKCLWGVDLTKVIDAKISLTYENGEQVQVETWSGKLVGNVYVLTASGFHFSSPKISFKLVEERKAQINPSPSPSPAETLIPQAVKAKKTIACMKGKILKKVTAVSPKCPKGFKKKI